MCTISIVTKTYNRLPFLLECISSVQLIRNEPLNDNITWEHVIYDDGSTDGTYEHFQKHTYPQVRYIRSDQNRGIAKAANAAISTCDTEYIFELDSDDLIPQRTLYNVYHTLREYPNVPWIVADFFKISEQGVYQLGSDYYGWQFRDSIAALQAIFSAQHYIQHNVCYRKDVWERVGGYGEACVMAEDLDLYIRFLLHGHTPVYVPYISHFHRIHAGNISRGIDLETHKKDLAKLYQKYSKDLIQRGITRSYI